MTGALSSYLVGVIRQALEDHAPPRDGKPGCTYCQGALAALDQLVCEEADRGEQPTGARVRDMSSVYIFNTYATEPTYHAYGRIDRKKDADVTRCGRVMWDLVEGIRYGATIARDHADKFARPCARCFRDE